MPRPVRFSLQGRSRCECKDDLVLCRFLELRAEILKHALECGRAKYLEIRRLRMSRQ